MADSLAKNEARIKRTTRIRHKLTAGPKRLRLTVFRSNKNIYAQIIDDTTGKTVAQASTLDKEFRTKAGDPFNRQTCKEVGKRIAERAKAQNIAKVVFDRGPYLYHGKIRSLADGAREGGLEF